MNMMIQTLSGYSYIDACRKTYKKRLKKAQSLHLDESSPYYKAYKEIEFRYTSLEDACKFLNQTDTISYPDIVMDFSAYLAEFFSKMPPGAVLTDDMMKKAANSKKYSDSADRYCKAMDVFANYKVQDEAKLLEDAMYMFVYGIQFWICFREQLCHVNKTQ